MKFDSIDYLKEGNNRQRQAFSILTNNQILSKLKQFDPILVGTIPINIDIENSDLDIICCFTDKLEFYNSVTQNFCKESSFTIQESQNYNTLSIVANFFVDEFRIEIFGQNILTKQQFAYRHLIAEYNLLKKYGENFRQQIIGLKRQGHKTEQAFAIALNLSGDPYMELLKFYTE
ncbi:DUF4269 domain-containing protein [Leptospira sp. GIMC2001]|uniref:DUF4269 domain-containing protein n=1 Tax=Leptospira sp. GIMC2001 TaxID=1513297 RepID=UPI00234A464F|nr:DUF4269 domain-containing protein [Leptospira sp. GIMC2001]WCL50632.1 DUF4269 domain-containing protein [Leptospira sp. GIMC2001]